MRASGGLVTVDPEGEWPRLLPLDRRARRNLADVREVLERVQLDLERYGATWTVDPPNPDEIEMVASELVDAVRTLLGRVRTLPHGVASSPA